jgi:hypothetical protein
MVLRCEILKYSSTVSKRRFGRTFCIYIRCQDIFNEVRIYKTIILPVILYGYETWSLTTREEHKLRVFENRVLRGTFGPKRDGVTRGWRK